MALMHMRLATVILVFASACGVGGGGGDDGSKARMAADLVTCKNEKNRLKEQVAEAKAEVEKTKAEAEKGFAQQFPTVELHGGMGQPKHIEGNIPAEAVTKVLKQNIGGLRACYEHALKRKPDLQFVQTVSARFAVKNTGNATNVSFAPHADGEMERCMGQAMEKWKFPTFQGDPVAVELPISLVSK